MDTKTVLKIFGDAFVRSLVVMFAILIVGFAAFFAIKINTDKKSEKVASTEAQTTEAVTTEAVTTTEEITTEEVTTEEMTTEAVIEEIPSTDQKILVLNSTGVAGLAKAWMNKLTGAGMADVSTGNYVAGKEETTKIFVAEEGMGNDLLQYFVDAEIIVGGVDATTYNTTGGAAASDVKIFIVIGSKDSTVQ